MTFHSFKSLTIAPLARIEVHVTGSYFLCVEATGSFLIGFNDQPLSPCQLALGYVFTPPDQFTRILFENPSYDTPVAIGYFTSNARVIDNRANIVPDRAGVALEVQAPTYILPAGETTLEEGEDLQLTGDQGLYPHDRKSVIVSNLGTSYLELRAPTGSWSVFPGKTKQVNTSYPVTLHNPGPGQAAFSASEVYYSLATMRIITELPAGEVGAAYAQQLEAEGGSGDYTWFLFDGALPAGLTLTAAGVLSGIPTAAGLVEFTIKARDQVQPAVGRELAAYRRYSITIAAGGGGGSALTDAIVAYYPLSTDGAALDLVAGHDTNINSAGYALVPGKISQAYRWAGAVRLRSVPGDPFDLSGQSFTLRLWARLNVANVTDYANLIRQDGGYLLRIAPAGVHGIVPSQNVPYWAWSNLGQDGIVWSDTALDQDWHRIVIWWNHLTNTMGIRIDDGNDVTAVAVGAPAIYNAFCMAGGVANQVETCEVGLWNTLWTEDDFANDWNNGDGLTYPFL